MHCPKRRGYSGKENDEEPLPPKVRTEIGKKYRDALYRFSVLMGYRMKTRIAGIQGVYELPARGPAVRSSVSAVCRRRNEFIMQGLQRICHHLL